MHRSISLVLLIVTFSLVSAQKQVPVLDSSLIPFKELSIQQSMHKLKEMHDMENTLINMVTCWITKYMLASGTFGNDEAIATGSECFGI